MWVRRKSGGSSSLIPTSSVPSCVPVGDFQGAHLPTASVASPRSRNFLRAVQGSRANNNDHVASFEGTTVGQDTSTAYVTQTHYPRRKSCERRIPPPLSPKASSHRVKPSSTRLAPQHQQNQQLSSRPVAAVDNSNLFSAATAASSTQHNFDRRPYQRRQGRFPQSNLSRLTRQRTSASIPAAARCLSPSPPIASAASTRNLSQPHHRSQQHANNSGNFPHRFQKAHFSYRHTPESAVSIDNGRLAQQASHATPALHTEQSVHNTNGRFKSAKVEAFAHSRRPSTFVKKTSLPVPPLSGVAAAPATTSTKSLSSPGRSQAPVSSNCPSSEGVSLPRSSDCPIGVPQAGGRSRKSNNNNNNNNNKKLPNLSTTANSNRVSAATNKSRPRRRCRTPDEVKGPIYLSGGARARSCTGGKIIQGENRITSGKEEGSKDPWDEPEGQLPFSGDSAGGSADSLSLDKLSTVPTNLPSLLLHQTTSSLPSPTGNPQRLPSRKGQRAFGKGSQVVIHNGTYEGNSTTSRRARPFEKSGPMQANILHPISHGDGTASPRKDEKLSPNQALSPNEQNIKQSFTSGRRLEGAVELPSHSARNEWPSGSKVTTPSRGYNAGRSPRGEEGSPKKSRNIEAGSKGKDHLIDGLSPSQVRGDTKHQRKDDSHNLSGPVKSARIGKGEGLIESEASRRHKVRSGSSSRSPMGERRSHNGGVTGESPSRSTKSCQLSTAEISNVSEATTDLPPPGVDVPHENSRASERKTTSSTGSAQPPPSLTGHSPRSQNHSSPLKQCSSKFLPVKSSRSAIRAQSPAPAEHSTASTAALSCQAQPPVTSPWDHERSNSKGTSEGEVNGPLVLGGNEGLDSSFGPLSRREEPSEADASGNLRGRFEVSTKSPLDGSSGAIAAVEKKEEQPDAIAHSKASENLASRDADDNKSQSNQQSRESRPGSPSARLLAAKSSAMYTDELATAADSVKKDDAVECVGSDKAVISEFSKRSSSRYHASRERLQPLGNPPSVNPSGPSWSSSLPFDQKTGSKSLPQRLGSQPFSTEAGEAHRRPSDESGVGDASQRLRTQSWRSSNNNSHLAPPLGSPDDKTSSANVTVVKGGGAGNIPSSVQATFWQSHCGNSNGLMANSAAVNNAPHSVQASPADKPDTGKLGMSSPAVTSCNAAGPYSYESLDRLPSKEWASNNPVPQPPEAETRRHPLSNEWCLFMLQDAERRTPESWAEKQIAVHQFGTVEDFWCMVNFIHPPSHIGVSDYSLFKKGVAPAWEDETVAQGGRWVAKLPSRIRTLDEIWYHLIMAVIGESLLPSLTSEICGAVVSVRSRSLKLALWIATREEGPALAIGRAFQRVLYDQLDLKDRKSFDVSFQSFKDNVEYKLPNPAVASAYPSMQAVGGTQQHQQQAPQQQAQPSNLQRTSSSTNYQTKSLIQTSPLLGHAASSTREGSLDTTAHLAVAAGERRFQREINSATVLNEAQDVSDWTK